MPIYAYKCGSCGHAKDVLQKISDEPLTVCPSCGAASFAKQVTAAGFQLKGSGWYVTDFRNGPKGATGAAASGSAAKPAESNGDGAKSGDGAAKPAEGTAAASKPDTPSAAGGCGGGCACH